VQTTGSLKPLEKRDRERNLKVGNKNDITLQTIWPAAKFLVKKDGVGTPT